MSDKAYYQAGTNSVSLKYDSLGTPHIAYTTDKKSASSVGTELWYATYTTGTGGGCGSGSSTHWICQALAYRTSGATGTGLFPSLQLNHSNQWRIVYYDPLVSEIFYYKDMVSFWDPIPVAAAASVNSLSFQLREDLTNEYARIAFIDGASGLLKHAFSITGSSTTCGLPGSPHWQCDTVDTAGTGARGLSLAVDPAGYSVIAYENAPDEGPSSVKVAQMWIYGPGNCGVAGDANKWQCEWVEAPAPATGGYVSMGAYVALTIDPDGLGRVAYSVDDDFYSTGSLRFAYQALPVYLPLVRR